MNQINEFIAILKKRGLTNEHIDKIFEMSIAYRALGFEVEKAAMAIANLVNALMPITNDKIS